LKDLEKTKIEIGDKLTTGSPGISIGNVVKKLCMILVPKSTLKFFRVALVKPFFIEMVPLPSSGLKYHPKPSYS